jgi:hypothetical protein
MRKLLWVAILSGLSTGCRPDSLSNQAWDTNFKNIERRVYVIHDIAPGSTLSSKDIVLSQYVGGLADTDTFASLDQVTGRQNWRALQQKL